MFSYSTKKLMWFNRLLSAERNQKVKKNKKKKIKETNLVDHIQNSVSRDSYISE